MKVLTKAAAAKRKCRCGAKVTWARSEATDRVLRLDEAKVPPADAEPGDVYDYGEVPDGAGDLVMTGEERDTARGSVPVVRYVRPGAGTHLAHVCGG